MKRKSRKFDFSTIEGRRKFYNSTNWRNMRGYMLMKYPLCWKCKKENKLKPSEAVDHIVPLKELTEDEYYLALDESNLQCLCAHHHAKKTYQESNFTNKKPETRIVNSKYNFPNKKPGIKK